MRNIKTYKGKFEIVKRLPSSVNGNPRFLVKIGNSFCRTGVDCSLGYSVQKYDGKQVIAEIGKHYGVSILNSIEKAA